MNLEEAKKWIESQEFVWAKSYAKTLPHYYTTRSRCAEDMFEQFLWLIREHGKVKTFHSKQYLYLELGQYEYWEMGRPIPAVQVLNRAVIDDNAPFRYPNPTEGEKTLLKAKLLKREVELRCLLEKKDKTADDEKILKFLLNSERRIHGGGKNIIDHSKITIRYE